MAFQAAEREPEGVDREGRPLPRIFTDEADLGALLTNDFHQAVIDIRDFLLGWGKARIAAIEEEKRRSG